MKNNIKNDDDPNIETGDDENDRLIKDEEIE